MGFGIAKYEGKMYDGITPKGEKDFTGYLMTARDDGNCEGCQTEGKVWWFSGLWMCKDCLKQLVDEETMEE